MMVRCLELAQKLVWVSQIFLTPHRPNQPATRLRANGFPSQPSQIMHWMYQVAWHFFEAVVWPLCWLDILNWLKNMAWASQIFVIPHTVQTSLLQDMDPVDSYPTISNHALDVSSGFGMFLKL
jgi:hypothetical protein